MSSNFIVCAALGALAFAAPAVASTMQPTASLTSTGTLSLSATDGFTASGDLVAEYRQPPLGARPYIYSTSLSFGTLTVTPKITLTTPEILISEAGEFCPLPWLCFPVPAVTLPPISLPINPSLPIASLGTVYDASYTSPNLAFGDLLAFDYGTPLLGAPLNFGELVQDQFETGDTTVNVAGGLGPFGAMFDYNGVLSGDGTTITGDYNLSLTGPGILADLEAFALDLLNDNTDQFVDIAFDLFLASDPCGLLGQACIDALEALDSSEFGINVTSLGTLTADYKLAKSITPVPLPAGLPLLLAGLGGLAFMRKRKAKAA